jgi:hypothetical protein
MRTYVGAGGFLGTSENRTTSLQVEKLYNEVLLRDQ